MKKNTMILLGVGAVVLYYMSKQSGGGLSSLFGGSGQAIPVMPLNPVGAAANQIYGGAMSAYSGAMSLYNTGQRLFG